MKKYYVFLLALFVLLTACGPPRPETPTPSLTPRPQPPPTPLPTPVVYKNPLTGLETQNDISKNRPYAVMLNDLEEALPQCGVGSADLIYEVVAEGGITRMLAVYQDISKAGKIGSVRSTRTYFLDLAEGLDAILIHAGASTYAYEAFKTMPLEHVDGIYDAKLFYRDEARMSAGYEHSLFTDSALIQENISDYVAQLKHSDGYICNLKFGKSSAESGIPLSRLDVEFSGYKSTYYLYNQSDGLYHAGQFNAPYIDGNTGGQVAVKNVLVLYTKQSAITNDSLKRIDVDLTGSGTGLYASGGKYIEINWSKAGNDAQFIYKLKDGSTLTFAPGKTYINIISTDRSVEIS